MVSWGRPADSRRGSPCVADQVLGNSAVAKSKLRAGKEDLVHELVEHGVERSVAVVLLMAWVEPELRSTLSP